MKETGFVKYETVLEILKKADFLGFTAKREDGGRKITYTFKNVKWSRTNVKISILKLEPKKFGSTRIVIGIKMNGIELEGLEDFRERIEGLGKTKDKKPNK